jgi:hypothetical protein
MVRLVKKQGRPDWSPLVKETIVAFMCGPEVFKDFLNTVKDKKFVKSIINSLLPYRLGFEVGINSGRDDLSEETVMISNSQRRYKSAWSPLCRSDDKEGFEFYEENHFFKKYDLYRDCETEWEFRFSPRNYLGFYDFFYLLKKLGNCKKVDIGSHNQMHIHVDSTWVLKNIDKSKVVTKNLNDFCILELEKYMTLYYTILMDNHQTVLDITEYVTNSYFSKESFFHEREMVTAHQIKMNIIDQRHYTDVTKLIGDERFCFKTQGTIEWRATRTPSDWSSIVMYAMFVSLFTKAVEQKHAHFNAKPYTDILEACRFKAQSKMGEEVILFKLAD